MIVNLFKKVYFFVRFIPFFNKFFPVSSFLLFQGLKNNFYSKMLLCGWHIQKNISSKLSAFGKKDKEKYQEVLNLPFITCRKKFDETLKNIFDSENLTETEKDYLNAKLEGKDRWAKSYIKSEFCGGICTTSRVEGLHAVLKKYLNSNSSLIKVFQSFRLLESLQLEKFQEEFQRHSKKQFEIKTNPLEEIKNQFSDYIFRKISPKFAKALSYILEPIGKSKTSW